MTPERKEITPRLYKVTVITEEGLSTIETYEKPPLGGYISMEKYGNPDYCPSATRHHKMAKEKTGQMKNLIFFDSVQTAVACGFSPCGNCWIKGEMALSHWQEYLDACNLLGVVPIQEPKIISKLTKSC